MPDWVSKRENFSVPSRLVHDASTEVSQLHSLGQIFTIAGFVNKVFFEQSQDHLCSICGCFCPMGGGLSSCQSMVGLSFTGDVCRPWFQENKMVHWDLAAIRAPRTGLWGTVRRVVSLRRPRLSTRPPARLIYLVGTQPIEGLWVLFGSFQLLVWGYSAILLAEFGSDWPPYSNPIVSKKKKKKKL